MTITAKIIADSISDAGVRLTTMQLRYPRMVHQELMTHRSFSRSASSSRAIPVERMLADVENDPAMPVYWGKNQSGMQARDELAGSARTIAEQRWLDARDAAVEHARRLLECGLHKQLANRVTEAFQHINVVVTATDYDNFFALRCHPDAQPEIQALARAMYLAQSESDPELLKHDQWHLPYLTAEERYWARLDVADGDRDWRQVSAARCARVSYNKHDGSAPDWREDMNLYNRLAGSQPIHASPMEHQATPDIMLHAVNGGAPAQWLRPDLHGNLRGWRQFRRMIPGNTINKYDSEQS